MTEKERVLIGLDELKLMMLSKNSPTGVEICKGAIDYINNLEAQTAKGGEDDEFVKLYRDIRDWQKAVFLKNKVPPYDIKLLLAHLRKEIDEVERTPFEVDEWADMFILLLGGFARQFEHRGHIAYSLLLAAKQKMKINKEREWGEPNEDRIIEHKREIKENNLDTKKQITEELNRLKDFGFIVVTMNDKRPLRSAQKNFVDHFITNGKYVVFAEVKIGKDKLSEGQKKIGDKLSSASVWNKYTHMKYLRTVADARRLVELLLKGEL